MPTSIHRLVDAARAGDTPRLVFRTRSGWVVAGDPQVIPGYCLLLPDPVVATLNDLAISARSAFLSDMAQLGDCLLRVTGAARINYEILGNLDPALHAHVVPRFLDEPEEVRTKPFFAYDWAAASPFEPSQHGELFARIRAEARATGLAGD